MGFLKSNPMGCNNSFSNKLHDALQLCLLNLRLERPVAC